MAAVKGCNVYPSAIAVPSLTASDFVITAAGSGFDITTMKTTLLALDGAMFFDTEDTNADHVVYDGITVEAVQGVKYNSNTDEQLTKITVPFEPNTVVGTTGETARTATEGMRHKAYDWYVFDNTARDQSGVVKVVGVTVDLTQPTLTPFEKFIQTASGQGKCESASEFNVLEKVHTA